MLQRCSTISSFCYLDERITCPWAGTLLPPRTIEALVSGWISETNKLDADAVNTSISLFNSLDSLEHISGGNIRSTNGESPKLQECESNPDGSVSKRHIVRAMETFTSQSGVSLGHVIHTLQELQEIQWVFAMWAGSKLSKLDPEELQSVLKRFNKWSIGRHEVSTGGVMAMNAFEFGKYGRDIDLRAFTRWVWEELSVLEKQFGEPFELTLGKLSELIQVNIGVPEKKNKTVERCPWSGNQLPPRTISAMLRHYTKDALGRYGAEEINSAISIFNSLDCMKHLAGSAANPGSQEIPKMQTCVPGPDGRVTENEITNALNDFVKSAAVKLAHVVHIFQEIQEIEWVFNNLAGESSAVKLSVVTSALKHFNKWAAGRHSSSAKGMMVLSQYDVYAYGSELNLSTFSRWLWEELSALEETFGEPFEMTLQYFDECAQHATVMHCFRSWDTVGKKTIDSKVMLSILVRLFEQEVDVVDTRQLQSLIEAVESREDGTIDYADFIESVMLPA